MAIEKITKQDIEMLNKEGNIYATKDDIKNGNSVDINAMYFGDNGEMYLDDQGRIIEKQEDGSEVYMGWIDKNKIEQIQNKNGNNTTTSYDKNGNKEVYMTIPGNEGNEITKNEFASLNKKNNTTTSYDKNSNKEVYMTIPGNEGNEITKNEFASLNKKNNTDTLKTAASSSQSQINSAWDYNKVFKNGEAPTKVSGNVFQKLANGTPQTQTEDSNIKLTPVEEKEKEKPTEIYFAKDGKPIYIYNNIDQKTLAKANNEKNTSNENFSKTIVFDKKGNAGIIIEEDRKTSVANNANNTYGDTITGIDNVQPYKETNKDKFSKIYDTTAATNQKRMDAGIAAVEV